MNKERKSILVTGAASGMGRATARLFAKAVADVVWPSYHDKTGGLHWYVPDDLEPCNKRVADQIEAERDARIEQFIALVRGRSSTEGD